MPHGDGPASACAPTNRACTARATASAPGVGQQRLRQGALHAGAFGDQVAAQLEILQPQREGGVAGTGEAGATPGTAAGMLGRQLGKPSHHAPSPPTAPAGPRGGSLQSQA